MDDETDERLKQELEDGNIRSPRTVSAARRSRESEDRQMSEDREVSDDERLEMFRRSTFNDVLPDLPEIPGYHVCWLSTTHPSDTIARRLRWGYTPIKETDVKGMDFATLKTGDYAGVIGVNEMVAFKIPLNLYRAFMQEYHHVEPARQAEAIASTIDQFKEQAAQVGGRIVEGDGMEDIRQSAPSRGIFAD